MEELQSFTPEQITAMLLTKLKETAESGMKTKVVDVVVSVSILSNLIICNIFLTLSQTSPGFLCVCSTSLLKTLWEKEK